MTDPRLRLPFPDSDGSFRTMSLCAAAPGWASRCRCRRWSKVTAPGPSVTAAQSGFKPWTAHLCYFPILPGQRGTSGTQAKPKCQGPSRTKWTKPGSPQEPAGSGETQPNMVNPMATPHPTHRHICSCALKVLCPDLISSPKQGIQGRL